mmetsp:Transcript_32453/g.79274  ORF Transcript_32453/g.79274 Transcript_32453/m.79274 type:complete len:236 (-) Transcript_32453:1590-2297(-)
MSSLAVQMGSGGQGPALHAWRSYLAEFRWLAHRPAPRAGASTCLTRRWLPPPQALVQGFQGDHSESLQSSSQESTLHCWVSPWGGQASPPKSGRVSMVRTRACRPLPHSLEHRPHLDHSPILQLMGQGNSLHFLTICNGGHLIPKLGFWDTLRTSTWRPLTQLLLHSWGLQSVTTQSKIFSGFMDPLENFASSLRTLRRPHKFIIVSPTNVLHLVSAFLYSSLSARCSRCFSTWV